MLSKLEYIASTHLIETPLEITLESLKCITVESGPARIQDFRFPLRNCISYIRILHTQEQKAQYSYSKTEQLRTATFNCYIIK